ncbi:YifB family Mg chelatase-like AAA ATPase [Acetivibrio sp. MSJd-27]|uniref:YifB family Mg chelatase-like AAA ATPase n=1 Tax=Acetivibrio sp. MSJd-27 TaxID=2841523 RepID=UPI001C0F931C|nr:YifB family Mg chelatase-like AAA ATPase [Acetivibrio sp. MSJd-27]MBU5449466.1 YifB family Mg chelatase-like AAA ATPase [Acetivibrio sp. MSJd-27]
MSNVIYTAGISGIEGYLIEVESDFTPALPSFDIVGLPDAAVKESRERIRAAIKNSGLMIPHRKIVVNLAPAAVRKEGSHFDFPIAMSILCHDNGLNTYFIENAIFLGELSLDGTLREVDGVLPIVISAYEKGIKNVFLPEKNAKEAAIIEDINVYPVKNLLDCFLFMKNEKGLEVYRREQEQKGNSILPFAEDFADVKGQESVKRALEVAAAGAHNCVMVGAPGSGKTMIAKRLPSILPPLSLQESLEVTKIYSVAGLLSREDPLIRVRPFRQVHHTASTIGITGGGKTPKPGEISLSHRGVMFLDELPEFRRDSLETLRQPLEDGKITVTRVTGSATYPCSMMVVASMNPCPCGFYSSGTHRCSCTATQIKNYLKKISGPLLDRIDLHIEVPSVEYEDLADKKSDYNSSVMRERVQKARDIQLKRYQGLGFYTNSEIPSSMIDTFCVLGQEENTLMKNAYESLGLSARAHNRILKVARTIADLDNSERITAAHLAEAIGYRSLDKKYWN